MSFRPILHGLLAILPASLGSQQWNTPDALELINRAITQREAVRADSGLRDYHARAHGFVFFLAQLGEGLAEPPRLVKSDELQLEVYWKAPNHSKQEIIGWRDRVDLPTDIEYHRDHLGIVQNNFSNRIRLGAGDEVRDVPHPLAPEGPSLYDYRVGSPIALRLPNREVRVREVEARPRTFDEPRVVGSLFIDVESFDLVAFRFSFTRSAYLDATLEDITIVLENGLWNERYWLPRRQEIEIRRRTSWLDLPARGIIRGRWEIDQYDFNLGLKDSRFLGPEVVAAAAVVRDSFAWEEPFDASVREAAGPVATFDLEAVRGDIGDVAGAHALSGLARARPSVGGISDLARFNRVEGLAVGGGWVLRPGGPWEVRIVGSYGLNDEAFKGRLEVAWSAHRWRLLALVARSVEDVADEPAISRLLNSMTSQEAGQDYGDYFLSTRASASAELNVGSRHFVRATGRVEDTKSLPVVATPATGTFRSNPQLGAGTLAVAGISAGRRPTTIGHRQQWSGLVAAEAGYSEGSQFARMSASLRLQVPVGETEFVVRGNGGRAWGDVPRHRSFVFGGRGTLVGEEYRAWGGRATGVLVAEWRVPIPFPAIPLGPLASTGRQLVVAPFIGGGWAGGAVAGVPWQPTGGQVRSVAGLGIEWFHGLFRVDLGVRGRDPQLAVLFDVRRDLWEIL